MNKKGDLKRLKTSVSLSAILLPLCNFSSRTVRLPASLAVACRGQRTRGKL